MDTQLVVLRDPLFQPMWVTLL